MYTKILVPLDGSELAEVVLPYVIWFIEVSEVNEIVFLRVVEPFRVAGGLEAQVTPEEKDRIERDAVGLARKYLDKIAGRFKDSRIKINRVVLVGKPAKPSLSTSVKAMLTLSSWPRTGSPGCIAGCGVVLPKKSSTRPGRRYSS